MPSGYRLLGFAALTAALFVAFGSGLYWASLNYPDEQRHQPYRYATDKPQEADPVALPKPKPETLEYRVPCEQPKGRDESDLCAQWRAAKAAENSAFWAKWGFGITVVGVFGLFATIMQGRVALARASEANRIAQAIGERQVRAYVHIDAASIKFWGNVLLLEVDLRNTGQSPSPKIELEFSPCVWIRTTVLGEAKANVQQFDLAKSSIDGGIVGANSSSAKSAVWVVQGESGEAITNAAGLEGRDHSCPIVLVHYTLKWWDVFGEEQETVGSISAHEFSVAKVLDGEGLSATETRLNHIGTTEQWLAIIEKAKEDSENPSAR